jgi:hypothetical protein
VNACVRPLAVALALMVLGLASCRHTPAPAQPAPARLEILDAMTRMHLNALYKRKRIDSEGLGRMHIWGTSRPIFEDLSQESYAAALRALDGDPQRGEIERRLRGMTVAQRLDAQEALFLEDKSVTEAAKIVAARYSGAAELLRAWPGALRLPASPEVVVTAVKAIPRRYFDDDGVLRDGCELGIWARRGLRACVRYGQVVWSTDGWEFRETEGEGELY